MGLLHFTVVVIVDPKLLRCPLLAVQRDSTEVIGFRAADIFLPKGTIRLSSFTTTGLMVCSPLCLALEEITMSTGSGEAHKNAFLASHRCYSCRCHFLVL
ncbi:hypothetical protein BsWGS_01783 [Bradybaena similaris]